MKELDIPVNTVIMLQPKLEISRTILKKGKISRLINSFILPGTPNSKRIYLYL